MRILLKGLVYGLVGLLALALGAGAFFYMALPTDFVRTEITNLVRERTGRTVKVEGPVSIAFYPDVTVELSRVVISPPPDMPGEAFLTVKTLGLKMPFWPLLHQQFVIERFTLDQPVVRFRTDKAGRRSWDFAAAATSPGKAPAAPVLRGSESADQPTTKSSTGLPAAASRPRADALAGLTLGDVRILDGTLHFADDRTGQTETLSHVSLQLALASMQGALKATGAVTWSDVPVTVNAELSPAEGLITGAPITASTSLQSAKANGAFKGRFAVNDATVLAGKLDLKTASLRELLQWLRHPLPKGPGFGATTVSADIGLTAKSLKVANLTALADGMAAKGNLTFDRAGARPMLTADLTIDKLDLNTYLPSKDAAAITPAAAAVPAAVAGKDASKPAPVEAPATTVAGDWSNAPIDVSALRQADADVKLTLGGLQFQAVKVGRSVASAVLKDGTLRTRFNELTLYGGKGTGTVVLDARAPAAKIETSFALKGVDLQPLLQDATGLNRLSGRGNVSFAFAGAGKSQRDLVKTLQGQGRMEVANGSIAGYDVPAMVRSLRNGNLSGLQDNAANRTAFSSLTGTSTMTAGIMSCDDLTLISPALRMTGNGTASLPAKSLDYTLKPAILAAPQDSADGADSTASVAELVPGLSLPVRVTGPWSHPKFSLDLAAIAKNPGAAVNAVKQALAKVKGGDKVGEAVTKLANTKEGKAIGDLLGGLLGKKQQQDAETALGLGQ
jgi:AsmA protein